MALILSGHRPVADGRMPGRRPRSPGAFVRPCDSAVTQVYLGRPWRPYATVAVLESVLGAHIAPAGWHDWNQPERRATSASVEYANTGPGAGRVAWLRALQSDEAAGYTRGEILGDWRPFE